MNKKWYDHWNEHWMQIEMMDGHTIELTDGHKS